jgi:hypothetical protein
MKNKRKYRMYGLVPYNISPIQQGIQFGHAVVEYGITYGNTEEYQKWSRNDKTFIILNGGTTNNNTLQLGSLNEYTEQLKLNRVPNETFYEPDLGNQLTAVVFLVDDRVWDRETWKDYDGIGAVVGDPDPEAYYRWKMKFADTEAEANQIVWLRDWLKGFRLA